MALIVSYDEDLAVPNSEIELASGEHVFLTLGREGLVIRLLPRPGTSERELFRTDPWTAAKICDGLFAVNLARKTSPLKILVAATLQLPTAAAVEETFRAASEA